VLLGTKEVSDIRERTFVSPSLLIGVIVQPNGSLRFDWSLGDIEEIQGHVVASANYTDDPKLEKRIASTQSCNASSTPTTTPDQANEYPHRDRYG
jgi:hypothetical protein